MANYRQIHVSIWKDEWFLDLTIDEKLFFIYLFSNELASLSGIYKLPLRVMAFETGLSLDFVKAGLAKFEKDEKVYYEDGIVWVKNLRRYNKGGNTVDKRIDKDIQEIPHCEIKRKYIAYYYPNIPYGYSIDTLSYEMKCNEYGMNPNEEKSNEEKGNEMNVPFPSTPLEAQNHPDIRVFHKVSGVTPGKSDYGSVIDSIRILRKEHTNNDDLESYLLPFWLAWESSKGVDGKPYSRTNIAWLTNWAVNNSIPPGNHNNGTTPKQKASGTAKIVLPSGEIVEVVRS